MAQLKVGIFGLWRGMEYVREFHEIDNSEVTAVFDQNPDRISDAIKILGNSVKVCSSFDELLDSGINAVILCNYFNEHTPYAIRAMERGIDVMSECTASVTLRECVDLVETVERTGRKYMLGENVPFMKPMREMHRICRDGTLGRILYAESEYNHTATREGLIELTPGRFHWRAWMPRTYYLTHTLGPLMEITGEMPKRVTAFAVHSDVLQKYDDVRHNYDALAMMNIITDDGALFRVSGCTAMGSRSGTRIVGENGSIETGRSVGENIYLTFQPWLIPDGFHEVQTYQPNLENAASDAGHGGGDYFVAQNFRDYILDDIEPFFDVYRSVAMSAVGILGWRSCLEGGRPYDIPDFSDPAQRDAVREDTLSPFPDAEGRTTLPCALPV